MRTEAWLYIVAIGVFAFAAVEFEKWLRFRTPQPALTPRVDRPLLAT